MVPWTHLALTPDELKAAIDDLRAGYVTPEAHAAAMREALEDNLRGILADKTLLGYVTPEDHVAALRELQADYERAASVYEMHWRGAGETINGDWFIAEWHRLSKLIEDAGDENDRHDAALREAWEAGRDAAAREVDGVAAIFPDGVEGANATLKAIARQSANIAKLCAERIRALTPPAPKGDDR
jgi:hypothetical protein